MKKFLAGMIAVCLIDPATTLITHLVELAKTEISIKIMENNVKIKKLDMALGDEPPTRAIGFHIPDNPEGDYEDEE